jgi:cbb3-type cytochrome oxidase subunit 3
MSFSKSKRYFLSILAGLLLASFFALPAQAQSQNIYGLNDSAAKVGAFSNQVAGYNADFLNTKVGSIIGLILSFVGVIFLILIIYAGISWMTASGNQEKVNKAKELIINAIIGLIIVLAAYAITAFIGNSLL